MPRKARIDAAGALHHIICRGIERRQIFRDDADRKEFTRRLASVIEETKTLCYAWALIPNHFHLLLRTGNSPVSTVMQRLLSGYAGAFNRRHRRLGQLFHNRYKSILCQEDAYLLELVRYINLNPLRARVVGSLSELESYPYSGHSALMGKCPNDWQEIEWVLALFGRRLSSARRAYRAYVEKQAGIGRRPELTGGGLMRSLGGWVEVKSVRKGREHLKGDERILGDSDFVRTVLEARNEKLNRRFQLKADGIDIEKLIDQAAALLGVDTDMVRVPGKEPQRVKARSLVCHWAVTELGMTTVAVSKILGICPTAVTKAASRGKSIAADGGLSLRTK